MGSGELRSVAASRRRDPVRTTGSRRVQAPAELRVVVIASSPSTPIAARPSDNELRAPSVTPRLRSQQNCSRCATGCGRRTTGSPTGGWWSTPPAPRTDASEWRHDGATTSTGRLRLLHLEESPMLPARSPADESYHRPLTRRPALFVHMTTLDDKQGDRPSSVALTDDLTISASAKLDGLPTSRPGSSGVARYGISRPLRALNGDMIKMVLGATLLQAR
jgi:hypothetical protein